MDRSKRFTLFAPIGRHVHSDTNSASPGSILVMQQLRATTKSLTCPPLSIARYSFIQASQLGRQWRERKCPIFETVEKGDSNPGSLDGESGVLPLSYRAPRYMRQYQERDEEEDGRNRWKDSVCKRYTESVWLKVADGTDRTKRKRSILNHSGHPR